MDHSRMLNRFMLNEDTGRGPPRACVFIANLPPDATNAGLQARMTPYGQVLKLNVVHSRSSTPYAFVQFAHQSSADAVLEAATDSRLVYGERLLRAAIARVRRTLLIRGPQSADPFSFAVTMRVCGQFGVIEAATELPEFALAPGRGAALVRFAYREDASACMVALTAASWAVEWARPGLSDDPRLGLPEGGAGPHSKGPNGQALVPGVGKGGTNPNNPHHAPSTPPPGHPDHPEFAKTGPVRGGGSGGNGASPAVSGPASAQANGDGADGPGNGARQGGKVDDSGNVADEVFVGGLNPALVTKPMLRQLFSEVGDVVHVALIVNESPASIMAQPHRRRKDAYGFVRFETVQQASAAISRLNGMQWLERHIRVQPCKSPKKPAVGNNTNTTTASNHTGATRTTTRHDRMAGSDSSSSSIAGADMGSLSGPQSIKSNVIGDGRLPTSAVNGPSRSPSSSNHIPRPIKIPGASNPASAVSGKSLIDTSVLNGLAGVSISSNSS